ncbi:hypothetical protein OROHE_016280 [Orobanche hederae]
MRKDMAVVFLFMLLFVFSSFPPTTTAVRFSRNLMSIGDENDSTQQLYDADFQKKGRMDIETSDYQTGPNPKHNPPPTPAPGVGNIQRIEFGNFLSHIGCRKKLKWVYKPHL